MVLTPFSCNMHKLLMNPEPPSGPRPRQREEKCSCFLANCREAVACWWEGIREGWLRARAELLQHQGQQPRFQASNWQVLGIALIRSIPIRFAAHRFHELQKLRPVGSPISGQQDFSGIPDSFHRGPVSLLPGRHLFRNPR